MSKTPPLPFRPTPFLFRMLVLIFLMECGFLAYAFIKCSEPLPENPAPLVNERCPQLGQRTQEIFQQAMAVTLSLLGGGAITGNLGSKKKTSSGDRDEPLAKKPESQVPASVQPPATVQPPAPVQPQAQDPAPVVVPGRRASQKNPQKNP
jgi:hypothetical protein